MPLLSTAIREDGKLYEVRFMVYWRAVAERGRRSHGARDPN